MPLILPLAAHDYADKAAFCYRALERLRIWHNEQAAKIGVEISHEDFCKWQREEWQPRNEAAFLTLHSLEEFETIVPDDYDKAFKKDSEHKGLNSAEELALSVMDERVKKAKNGKDDSSWDVYIEPDKFPRLNVMGEPPDPLQDFTSFTEVDALGLMTITSATQLDFSDPTSHYVPDCYVYKNLGSGYFSADFTHTYQINVTTINTGHAQETLVPWRIANQVENLGNDIASLHATLYVDDFFYYANYPQLNMSIGQVTEGGAHYRVDSNYPNIYSTNLYRTTIRNEAVGTYGTLYSYTYSNSSRTALLNVNSIALNAKIDYRYVYGLSTYNYAYYAMNGTMKDLDIGTTPIFMAGILKRYNGSSWVKAHLKADTAGGFSDSPMRLWDGANWVEVDRGG